MTLTTDYAIRYLYAAFQMPVRSMTLTTYVTGVVNAIMFQMPVRSMTLTTADGGTVFYHLFQMPVRSMTLTTQLTVLSCTCWVSDACQINDFDHLECI